MHKKPATLLRRPTRMRRIQDWLSTRVHNMSRRQRIISGIIASVLIVTAVIPTVLNIVETRRYQLDEATRALVGSVNSNLAAKLTYDSKGSQWQFNRTTETQPPVAGAAATLTAQAGGGGKNDKSLYRTDFPKDPKKGVTFTDTQTELSFTMTPEFDLKSGQAVDGRLIYPMKNGAKLIYTPKNNGMKEDIVLPKFVSKELTYSYKLNLPKTLTAKIQQDGSVGIFSADPILFGNITTSNDMDATKLKSAREQGEKNHLLFAIPAPVIVQSGDKKTKATAKFGLAGDVLTVTARDMDKVQYPASIDPSVLVTSSSEFASGNNENNIYYSTDQINRGKVTGGSIGTWSTTTPLNLAMEKVSTVAYNGYLYRLGGSTRSPAGTYETTEYAPINSNGTIGSWTSTTSLPAKYSTTEIVAHNGYMYLIADVAFTTSSQNVDTTYYSKINSDGTLGGWTITTALPQAIVNHAVVATGGYIYTLGGSPTSGGNCGANGDCMNTVYYAPLNANGTIGTWNTTSSFATARAVASATSYNGYIYIGGGGNTGYLNDVQYAKINNDGTLGSWMTTSSFANARYGHQFHAYNGYMYMYSGRGGGVGWYSDVQIAQINANGTLGAWTTTTSFTNGRAYGGGEIYKGYLYMLGGYNGSINYGDVQYTKIDNPGMASTSTASTTMGAAIDAGTGGAGFMYNGFLYYIGGYNGTAYSSQARYASINSSGTVGTWNTTSALTAPIAGGSGLGGGAYTISNNRVYMIGGTTSTAGGTTSVASIQYASFNSNGTLSSWTLNPTDYVNAFTNQSAVAYNGQVYVVGNSGGGATNRVHRALVNSDGTLGSWTWDGGGSNNLAVSTSSAGMVIHNKFIYLIGGYNSPNYLDAVQFAAINNDGSLGTWTATTSLPTARNTLSVTILNGYMYAIGGETTGGTYSNAVDFAKINTDGTLGTWQSSTNLAATYSNGGVAVWNDRIYLLSGRNNGTRGKTVLYITTRSGGGGFNNTWTTSGNTFANGRQSHGSAILNGYLYVIGGVTATSTRTNSVQYAKLNDDGTIGTWSAGTNLPDTRAGMGVITYGNHLYVFGGKTSDSTVVETSYSALMNVSNGSLGSWNAIADLPDQISSMSASTRNGYVYLLGGIKSTAFNTVYYAPLNSNGTTGSWNTTTSFTTARSNAGVVVNGNYIYIMGGVDGSNNYLRDVQYAPINSDGTLGSWSYTTEMSYSRAYISPTVLNGFLYVYGGYDGTNSYNKVDYVAFNANGTIGAWTNGTNISSARYGQRVDMHNGYAYLTGGYTGTYQNSAQYSAIQTQPRTATYSRIFDLGALYNLTTITYGGSLPGGTNAIRYRAAGSDGVFGNTLNASSLSGATGVCTAGQVRYIFVSATMDDATRSTLADENGSESYISHLSVNYNQPHAPTEKRLAHGKFFEEEVLQPLDTCAG